MKKSNPRRGGILGTLLVIVAVVVVAAVCAGVYVARNVRVVTEDRKHGADVNIETPVGAMHFRAHENLDPSKLGVPVYPGARREQDSGGASFEWVPNDGDGKNLAVAGGSFQSDDRPDAVLAYYRKQLPSWILVTDRHGETRLELKEGGSKRIVSIQERNGGTRIGVASIGEPASN